MVLFLVAVEARGHVHEVEVKLVASTTRGWEGVIDEGHVKEEERDWKRRGRGKG